MSDTCFVISPFGAPFDEYYEKVFKPAIARADLEPIRGDEVYNAGAIIDDIFAAIVSARVILCDVTNKNPNVNYELGVAHALRKPTIIVTQSIVDVPFDYRHLRVIVYDRAKVEWAKELDAAIHKTLITVLGNPDRALAWRPAELPTDGNEGTLVGIAISYSPNPSLATLRYRNQFVLLQTRCGDVHPGFKQFFEEIYPDLEALESGITRKEYLQLRSIWHDDKNGSLKISVDLIHDTNEVPTFSAKAIADALHDGTGAYGGQAIFVEVRIISRNIWSDSFFPNAPEFYAGP